MWTIVLLVMPVMLELEESHVMAKVRVRARDETGEMIAVEIGSKLTVFCSLVKRESVSSMTSRSRSGSSDSKAKREYVDATI